MKHINLDACNSVGQCLPEEGGSFGFELRLLPDVRDQVCFAGPWPSLQSAATTFSFERVLPTLTACHRSGLRRRGHAGGGWQQDFKERWRRRKNLHGQNTSVSDLLSNTLFPFSHKHFFKKCCKLYFVRCSKLKLEVLTKNIQAILKMFVKWNF